MGIGKKVFRFIKILFNSPEGTISTILLVFLLFLVIFGPLIAPYDSIQINMRNRFSPPSLENWFGTDEVGRDIFSRVIVGTRTSITAGLLVVLIATLIGVPLGLIAGYYGKYWDTIIMGLTDMLLGFPALILAIAVSAAMGPGIMKGVIAVSLVWWPGYARLVRGEVLAAKELLFVEASRAAGAKDFHIIFKHIFMSFIHTVIVKQTMDVGYAILFVASLGFVGLGAQPPQPEWGTMISQARPFILDSWWAGLFPGIAISISILAFNLLGDSLQEVVIPSIRKR